MRRARRACRSRPCLRCRPAPRVAVSSLPSVWSPAVACSPSCSPSPRPGRHADLRAVRLDHHPGPLRGPEQPLGHRRAQQCINVTDTGFAITAQQGSRRHQRRAAVVPVGLPGLPLHQLLPRHEPADPGQPDQQRHRVDQLHVRQRAPTTRRTTSGSTRRPGPTGSSQMEIMIWFNRQGSIQPIGSAGGQHHDRRPDLAGLAGQQRRQQRHLVRGAVADQLVELQRAGLHQRRAQPRRDHQLVVPDQHPGGLRAVERRRRARRSTRSRPP